MRTKKSSQKTGNEEKENIDKNNCEHKENSPTKLKNNSNTTCNPVVIGAHKEEQKAPSSENGDLLTQKNKSKGKQVDDNFILSDISNKSNEIETSSFKDKNTTNESLTGPEVCRGKKRPIEEPSNSFESDGDEINLIQLKKKCLELERRVQELESMWMPFSQDLSMARNLLDDALNSVGQDNVAMNNNGEIINASQALAIDPNVLLKLKKQTATATARSILKYKIPRPANNFKLADVDKTLIDAIVLYSKQFHPNDKSTDYKIRKAMSNHFSLITYHKKKKSIIQNIKIEQQSPRFCRNEREEFLL